MHNMRCHICVGEENLLKTFSRWDVNRKLQGESIDGIEDNRLQTNSL